MNYENNLMMAAYRCILFAASGDGKISESELEGSVAASESTEGWWEFSGSLGSMFEDMLEVLGVESGEEEEEEEEESISALSEEELKEIAADVSRNIAKCKNAEDLKAYASLCSSAIPERMHGHIINNCFHICGTDGVEWMPDKKEIRNIKYLCSEFNINFKEAQTTYLHELTWYEDDLLGDDLSVEIIKKEYSGCEENTADAIARLSIQAAFSDAEFFMTIQSICEHWFLASCDIARIKKEKVVKIPEEIGVYIEALYLDALQDIWDKTKWEKAIDAINKKEEYELFGKSKEKIEALYPKIMDDSIALINDKSLRNIAYKNATFMCDNDQETIVGYSKMSFSFGGDTEPENMSINHHEEEALDYIGDKFGFDEDKLYGIKKRIEDGEMGSLWSN